MQFDDREKFAAAIALGDHASSVEELINLAQNLDCYWIYPSVHNEEEYGITLLMNWKNRSCRRKPKNISCTRNTGGTRLSMTGDCLPNRAISTTTRTHLQGGMTDGTCRRNTG